MTTTDRPVPGPLALVECPACDGALPFDAASGALDCSACGIRLELTPDPAPEPVRLPAAA